MIILIILFIYILFLSKALESDGPELSICLSNHLGHTIESGDVARSVVKVLMKLASSLFMDK